MPHQEPRPLPGIAPRNRIERRGELEGIGVEVTRDNFEAAKQADIVFICVKPGDVAGVLKEIAPEVDGKLVISTAAIVYLNYYEKVVPWAKFVRTMPHVAAFVSESFSNPRSSGPVSLLISRFRPMSPLG